MMPARSSSIPRAALREAEGGDGALARAEDAIDRLPPIPRRRLLAAYARLVT
jgi:hypothetical protein